MLRVAGPLARAVGAAARRGSIGAAADAALRQLNRQTLAGTGAGRHPFGPAALRVERARSRGNGHTAEQTAVTVWFGQGPSLPGPASGDAMRSAVRIGSSVLGAVALAALTAIATRREQERARVIDAPAAVPALPEGDVSR